MKVTNADRVLFPEDGITKGDVVAYYRAVGPRMVPHLRERPLTLQRYPGGIGAHGFFQKEASDHFPSYVARVEVAKKGGVIHQPVANTTRSLVYLANQGAVSFHVWTSRTRHLVNPDLIVFDLDPSSPDQFDQVRNGAMVLRSLLSEAGLVPFVKATGSRGLHVVVPVRPLLTYDHIRLFTSGIADALVQIEPEHFTVEMRKVSRHGRIFVDTMRSTYAHTVVAPWSVRPRAGAPVAVPLDWDEVADPALRPDAWDLRSALTRPDPWKGMGRHARALPVRRR